MPLANTSSGRSSSSAHRPHSVRHCRISSRKSTWSWSIGPRSGEGATWSHPVPARQWNVRWRPRLRAASAEVPRHPSCRSDRGPCGSAPWRQLRISLRVGQCIVGIWSPSVFRKGLYASFAELFEQRYDAILTPAVPGAAPYGLASTGDPVFCTPWTLCGMPAVSLPLFESAEGLPLGVQLVGARHADARLLRTARWLARRLAG